jgi:anaerobic selenocysteine-containing dehydrogenase
LLYTTGRTAYHFHTRTKTGRAQRLQRAAPGPWVELSVEDARALGITEGDVVRVESPRGQIEVPARVGEVMQGAVFAPFHYGSWQPGEGVGTGPGRGQANELTMTVWDPVSKQPYFKTAACRVTKVRDGDGPSPAPMTTASRPATTSRTDPAPSGEPATDGDR